MFEKTLNMFEKIESRSVNPFIGRCIVINTEVTNFGWENDFTEQSSAKFEKLCQILERFGKFVYHLEWVLLSPSVSGNKFYIILCRVLSYLPNLQTLRIRFWVNTSTNLKSLSPRIDNIQVPKSPFLYLVDLNIFNLPCHIEEQIILSLLGSHVKTLCLPISLNMINAMHTGMNSLSDLTVRSIYDFDLFKHLILKVKEAKIPLKKLKGEFSRHFDVSDILSEVQTLSISEINFGKSALRDKTYVKKSIKNSWFTFLHTCVIADSFDVKYNFLNSLPNLKYLIITKSYVVKEWYKNFVNQKTQNFENIGIENHVRLCVYCGLSPPTSFWERFPNLKCIIVESSTESSGFIFPKYLQNPVIKRYPRLLNNKEMIC